MILLLLAACHPDADSPGRDPRPPIAVDSFTDSADTGGPPPGERPQDVLRTALSLDLTALTGQAEVTVLPASGARSVRLHVGDLAISAVTVNDAPVTGYTVASSMLDVPTADADAEQRIGVTYTFAVHEGFNGWMASRGLTFTWPYFCGNLFPCDPDPADGQSFTLNVTGAADGQTAVYPTAIPADAPSYMLGIAVGDYTETPLGTTAAGTAVSVWSLPGEEADVVVGTKNLVDAFDFLERTYGPYTFGNHVGSVSAPWDDYGGMEHHPYWHIANWSLRSEEAHVHEAAHGWFGDGVRIACWEDLTLSEGTTTYITGRALNGVDGPNVFPMYVEELDTICREGSPANTVAMPGTCHVIDILEDPLWSMVPYMKGACFYQDLSHTIGEAELDAIIARFYADHVGGAATLQDMLDAISASVTPEQAAVADQLADDWLRNLDCPSDYAARCSVP